MDENTPDTGSPIVPLDLDPEADGWASTKPAQPPEPVHVPFYRKEIPVPRAMRDIPRKPIILVGAGIVTLGSCSSLFSLRPSSDSTRIGWGVILGLTAMVVGLALIASGLWLCVAKTRLGREMERIDPYFDGPSGWLVNPWVNEIGGRVAAPILLIALLPFFALALGVSWLIGRFGVPLGLVASASAVAVVWFAAGFVPLPKKTARAAGRKRDLDLEDTLPPKVCPGCGHMYGGAVRVVRTCRTCGAQLPY